MRLRCIACQVLTHPLQAAVACSPHSVELEFVPLGQHDYPKKLREELQGRIDAVDGRAYDAVLLGYGLCGQAVDGLTARSIPLVISRAHDCITLYLGSRERYQREFEDHPGTYWYTRDQLEHRTGEAAALSMGSGSDEELRNAYASYVQKFGRENADYLMEVMGAWRKSYRRGVYLELSEGDSDGTIAQAEAEATRRGWTFERYAADLRLAHELVNGGWLPAGNRDFLYIPAGGTVQTAYNECILDTCPR